MDDINNLRTLIFFINQGTSHSSIQSHLENLVIVKPASRRMIMPGLPPSEGNAEEMGSTMIITIDRGEACRDSRVMALSST